MRIKNNKYFAMPPKVAVSKDFLMMKNWHKKFDFEPKISSWANKPYNCFETKKTHDVGQSFWDEGSILYEPQRYTNSTLPF